MVNVIPQNGSFGSRLRAARLARGLDQTDFGAVGGVGRAAQSSYEKDDRRPDVDYLLRLANDGIDISELLTGIPSEKPDFQAWEIETVARLRSVTVEQRLAFDTLLKGLTSAGEPLISQALHSGRTSFAQGGDKR